MAGLRERFPDVELHLIGPLQSNKAREAVSLYDVIESLDRVSLAQGAGQGDRPGARGGCASAASVRAGEYR